MQANEQVNGRASGPVLTSGFSVVLAHSAAPASGMGLHMTFIRIISGEIVFINANICCHLVSLRNLNSWSFLHGFYVKVVFFTSFARVSPEIQMAW